MKKALLAAWGWLQILSLSTIIHSTRIIVDSDRIDTEINTLTVIAPPPVPKLLNYIKQINFKSEFVIKSICHRQTAPHRA